LDHHWAIGFLEVYPKCASLKATSFINRIYTSTSISTTNLIFQHYCTSSCFHLVCSVYAKIYFCMHLICNIYLNLNHFGNTLLEGVCIRLTWHLHVHDSALVSLILFSLEAGSWQTRVQNHVLNMNYACLWQLSLSVFHSIMSFWMQIWHCLKCLCYDILHHNLSVSLTTWHKMKLNCHVVGFDIGCHLAIITVSWIFFLTSSTVVLIEFVIKKL